MVTEINLNGEEMLLHLLGKAIASRRHQVQQEREAPRHDADKSDDIIKKGAAEVSELMTIRTQLERIFFGEVA